MPNLGPQFVASLLFFAICAQRLDWLRPRAACLVTWQMARELLVNAGISPDLGAPPDWIYRRDRWRTNV